MPYSGWVELSFQLSSGVVLRVPFLVVDTDIERPIIGFNVIIEMLKHKEFSLIDELAYAIEVDKKKAECVINLLDTISEDDFVSTVKSDKRNIIIPAGLSMKINQHGVQPTSAYFDARIARRILENVHF